MINYEGEKIIRVHRNDKAMIYVERKGKDTTERQDLNKIWKCLKTECKVYFKMRQLKALWEEFSETQYLAAFLIPSFSTINHFIVWLLCFKNKETDDETV